MLERASIVCPSQRVVPFSKQSVERLKTPPIAHLLTKPQNCMFSCKCHSDGVLSLKMISRGCETANFLLWGCFGASVDILIITSLYQKEHQTKTHQQEEVLPFAGKQTISGFGFLSADTGQTPESDNTLGQCQASAK